MQKKRPWLSSLIAAAAIAAAGMASAAGLGVGGTSAVLGQPLDFAVQVRLEPGETLSPDCIAAEVTMGDRRLAAGQVRTVLDYQSADMARIRVQTTQVIDEPVVGVQLGAGCASRQSRRFVLLADPPSTPAPSAPTPPAYAANLPDVAQVLAAPADSTPAMTAEAPVRRADAVVPRSAATPVPAVSTRRIAARDEAPSGSATAATAPRRAAPRTERGAPERQAAAAPRAAEAVPYARPASPPPPVSAAVVAPPPRPALTPPLVSAPGAPPPRPALPPPLVSAAVAPTPRPPSSPPLVSAAAPRLKLDFEEPVAGPGAAIVEEALQAVAMAASSARASASAAAAASDRISALEHTVDELRNEATASRQLVAELRLRDSRASDDAGRWTYPLLGAVLVLAALAAWLGWRLAEAQQQRQTAWRAAAAPPPPRPVVARERPVGAPQTAPIPFVTSEIRAPDPAAGPRPAWPPAAPPDSRYGPLDSQLPPIADTVLEAPPQPPSRSRIEPKEAPPPELDRDRDREAPMQRTEPLPSSLRNDDGSPRDVSIEELIDLEQQAEFFVVLGQDEAAVDLLVEHLRHTGGSSPLPYLKLLEIYHRRGDRDDYERTRARFNHRFNAYAPDWGVDLQAGRSIEDYAGIVPRLQQAWKRPLDAMAELEVLLFRKSQGELFDLPAYREVLLLYSLARDLHDREAVDAGNVDLLLPLADVGDFGATTAAPYLGLRPMPVDRLDRQELYDPPTAPVDFDLSKDTDRPTSIFDPLDDQPRPSRR
jgi:hypothetical protein